MKHAQITLLLFLIFGTVRPVHANEGWAARAYVNAPRPGIIEAVLPPELFMNLAMTQGRDQLDLALSGPEGNERSFELFWREPSSIKRVTLDTSRVTLDDDGAFVWEGEAPASEIDTLYVSISASRFVGQVDVEAMEGDAWRLLVRNAALFRSAGQTLAEIPIEPGRYKKIRLRFRSFDQAFQMKVLPLKDVAASGKTAGRDYARATVAPDLQISESDAVTELRALLPGSGLYIESIGLRTETQFQGHWQIGRETIVGGERTFSPLETGSVSTVTERGNELTFSINRKWEGKSLVIKLDPQGRYLGTPTDLAVGLFLPRLVFTADKPGIYKALSGTGTKAPILPRPGTQHRTVTQALIFSKPELNPNLTEIALTDRYRLKGGPFAGEGFAWSAAVPLAAPGYYRLPLPMEASLSPNRTGIRLSQHDTQVPFFMDRTENVELPLPVTPEYDKGLNQTTWTLTLPQPSPWWVSVNLSATGIFTRAVTLQIPTPGEMGWETWTAKTWQNTTDQPTTLKIPLTHFPSDQNRLRIVISHTDNEPLELTAINAVYTAPSLCFLAYDTAPLTLHGGHPTLSAPTYDLSLVQTRLLETIPTPIHAQPVTPIATPFRFGTWIALFQSKGWGLYAALALVAAVLLGIVAKMLPSPGKEAQHGHAQQGTSEPKPTETSDK